ncbi:MAG: 2OG-Fe(II) oxygenase [Sulfurimonas sp.]|jgi:SM-20-related protein|nr:2OG-Fe(II) oxygenase [Sulfurimonas sp.]
MSQQLYETITDALVKDGYCIIPNALCLDLSRDLLDIAKKSKNFKRAGISARKKIYGAKRRDKIRWLDHDGAGESRFLDFCDALREYLNRELFLGLSYFEAHFALYEHGDFYEKHYDAFKDSKNRVVTVVYYLNEDWDNKSGGELKLYDAHETHLHTLLPEADTLVVFLSEKFPHEVLKAKRKRYSIAGWFRVDIKEGVPLVLESLA